ncbi:MAG: family membership [Gemmatimonadota bacterium]|nr:family membership [Gemmatimonadota bacterium]
MRTLAKAIGILGALAAIALAGAILVFSLERRSDTTLPTPTGPFAVGRASYLWRNQSATPHPLNPEAPSSELIGWLWYPVSKDSGTALPYLPAEWLSAMQRSERMPFSLLRRDVARVHSHSVSGTITPQPRALPVLIMRGGLGARTLDYTTLAEELASHGYVVVGFDAPYRTGMVAFPDGRVVTRPPSLNPETLRESEQRALASRLMAGWVSDTRFVLDQLERLNADESTGYLTGRLDLRRVGVFGHSLGGATAAQVCHDDVRCKAGIDIDGLPLGSVVRDGLDRPFMFLLSEHGDTTGTESRRVLADIGAIYGRIPADKRVWITLRGSRHFNFSDQALLGEPHVFRLVGAMGPIDQRRALIVTGEYVRRFFDVFLGGASDTLLAASGAYPEIERKPR